MSYRKYPCSDSPQPHRWLGLLCVQDCPIFAAFRDGTVRRVDDEVFWCRDGHAVPVEYTSTPVYEHNTLVGAVVIFRDVSERKSAEAKLHNTMEELRAALEEVKQLKHKLELENAYLQQEISEGFSSHHIIGCAAPQCNKLIIKYS